jgi:hypothetical protein
MTLFFAIFAMTCPLSRLPSAPQPIGGDASGSSGQTTRPRGLLVIDPDLHRRVYAQTHQDRDRGGPRKGQTVSDRHTAEGYGNHEWDHISADE